MTSVFPIIPAGAKPVYLMIPIFLILAGVFFIVALTLYGSKRASLQLSPVGLGFRGDLYGRRPIPLHHLRTRDARIVNLELESRLRPAGKRIGTALPGYASGWFSLQSGEKALVYLTDRRKAVYIPTDLGYSILVSVIEPEKLLSELQSGQVTP
jgi:hypothetical protein